MTTLTPGPRFVSGLSFRRGLRAARRGFTLLEILIVLAILGLLATLAIQNFGGAFETAKLQAAELFVKQSMSPTLMTYRLKLGDYPSTAEGLQALVSPPAGKADRWGKEPFVKDGIPPDPWSEPYQYAYPAKRNKSGYDLWSKGPDKQDGTEDDIGNWPKAAEGAAK